MNGAHDMGGTMGFGPVVAEVNEPVFHTRWEARVRALVMAMGRPMGANIDAGRFAREDVSPAEYLSKSYYEIWYAGLVRMILARGLVTQDEMAVGKCLRPANPIAGILASEAVAAALAARHPYERSSVVPKRFALGSKVRTRNIHPAHHTRLPRYARDKVGVVSLIHGAHVFPDSNAAGHGEAPQWLYTVRFDARDLWGDDADPSASMSIDAWDSYLEPAA
jgi:nitrile hydratase subunit beta